LPPFDHTGSAVRARRRTACALRAGSVYGDRVTADGVLGHRDAAPGAAVARFGIGLLALTLLGLAVRLAYALAIAPGEIQPGDAFIYHDLARQLADGNGYRLDATVRAPYPTASHPPLYALYLAVFAKLGLTSFTAERVVSCFLGAAAVFGIGLLGRRVGGPRAGLIAAGVAAVYPQLFMVNGTPIAESLYLPLVVFTLLLAYRFAAHPVVGRAAALGAVIGLATLTRSDGVLLLAGIALPLALLAGRARWKLLAVIGATALVVLSPWLVRNWVRFDRVPLLSTNGALTQGATNCLDTYSGPLIGFVKHSCAIDSACFRLRGELPQADCFAREARSFMRDHAKRLPLVLAARTGRLWNVYKPAADLDYGEVWTRERATATVGLAMYAALALLAVWGALLLRRRRVPLLPLLATFVVATLTAMIAFGFSRYRLAAEPALVVLAAVAIEAAAVSTASRLRRAGRAPARADAAA
jgi:hypothetical protein